MPVILNTIYHLMLPEIITRSPCIFVPLILMHHVEYFGEHISLCSLPLGRLPAYTPITILYILLNGQHIKSALQIVIQYQNIIYLEWMIFLFLLFVMTLGNFRNSNLVCSIT